MMNLIVLGYAICFAILQGSASANSYFWFLPNAPITRYQTTMVVPAYGGGGQHAVWPGLENAAANFVFQSVVSDSYSPGSWTFFVEYCCNIGSPGFVYGPPLKVYPGDTITSTFSLNNGVWTDSWSLVPGATGSANGQQAHSGSSGQAFPSEGDLTRAILGVELMDGGSWDFGQVPWTSLSITASTTSGWCSFGYSSQALNYQVSSGTQSTSGGSTTCTYSSLQFIGAQ
ncbi:hypothetical protein LSUE1_G002628 [Lachnellula suecica]|uniref:Uncharacterized protein n=1 Tax=Lachnellula suecica TaxID=602035 RepID=A0A8T9C7G7_9HELO|nr:hypothetical protein LSUE1_G002628 [Lachnellula suecica]